MSIETVGFYIIAAIFLGAVLVGVAIVLSGKGGSSEEAIVKWRPFFMPFSWWPWLGRRPFSFSPPTDSARRFRAAARSVREGPNGEEGVTAASSAGGSCDSVAKAKETRSGSLVCRWSRSSAQERAR